MAGTLMLDGVPPSLWVNHIQSFSDCIHKGNRNINLLKKIINFKECNRTQNLILCPPKSLIGQAYSSGLYMITSKEVLLYLIFCAPSVINLMLVLVQINRNNVHSFV